MLGFAEWHSNPNFRKKIMTERPLNDKASYIQLFSKKLVLLASLAMLLSPTSTVLAATYQVTSPNCGAPGGLAEAIQQANINPGPDTVQIAAGLTISESCGALGLRGDSALQITESLVIEGNSSLFHGLNQYINTATGGSNELDTGTSCPGSSESIYWVAGETSSLFMIGQRDNDNTGVEVTIEDFSVDSVSQLASVRDGAKLTLRNVRATDVRDVQSCTRAAIEAFGNANLVLESVYMTGLTDFSDLPSGHIKGQQGKLEIYDSVFHSSLH
jgi:hypothetical protein